MMIPVNSDKHSDNVITYVGLNYYSLGKYCSKKYVNKIIQAHRQGDLWGLYFTKSGRIKATLCK